MWYMWPVCGVAWAMGVVARANAAFCGVSVFKCQNTFNLPVCNVIGILRNFALNMFAKLIEDLMWSA